MYQSHTLPHRFFPSKPMMIEDKIEKVHVKSEVRVVSFDLDNTLWNTSATIDAANDALASFLDSRKIVQPIRVEKVMGELFQKNMSRYCPLDEKAKAPVYLTLLRKDAIRNILEEANGYSAEEATTVSEEAFELWVQARHDAILNNMAVSAVNCLKEISSMQRKDGHRIIIGAITDGNSDPKRVQALAPFFDFCINAESVGVGKPDKRVYLEAIRQVASMPSMQDIFGNSPSTLPADSLEEKMGHFWVHVGDDFTKDVVAGKGLNMRTVWCRELILDSLKQQTVVHREIPPELSVEDLVKQVSEMKVVKMEIGAGDYLSEMLQNEFADSVIDSFVDLSSLLKKWHTSETPLASSLLPAEDAQQVSALHMEKANSRTVAREATEPANRDETKFCIFCGTKLPSVAKFCSGCGQAQ
jgi:FMN phosphatase YigB (HAD superfamily)